MESLFDVKLVLLQVSSLSERMPIRKPDRAVESFDSSALSGSLTGFSYLLNLS